MQTETAPTSLKIQLLQMVRKESGEFYPVKFGLGDTFAQVFSVFFCQCGEFSLRG